MRKRALAAWMAAALLAGCAGKAAVPVSGDVLEDIPELVLLPRAAEEDAPKSAPTNPPTNPLTGTPMAAADAARRPVAVVFNDAKQAQPQWGVSQADILYEVPAEGGVTRILGLYQSLTGVGTLGSIRSVRPYLLELALAHDAILVHAGGSPEAYREIPAWGVDHMDGVRGKEDAEIFWRDPDRRARMGYEHSLMTSGENIRAYLDRGPFPLDHPEDWRDGLSFGEDTGKAAMQDGATALHVEARFSNYKTAVFDYDGEAYLVRQFGAPHMDASTGGQVRAVNLLTLDTTVSAIPGDSAGRVEVETTGGGTGRLFHGGRTVPIRSSREDRTSPFRYTLEDGVPLALWQGTSYICLLEAGSVTFS